MYEDYDDESEGGSSLGRKIALAVGVVAVAALGWFVVTNLTGNGDKGQVSQGSTATTEAPATTARSDRVATPTTVRPKDAPAKDAPASTPPSTAAPETTATTPPTTTPPTTAAPAPAAPATYAQNPDGTPAWVVAIFDTSSITLSGAVPDQASKDRLIALATQYAKPGQAATVSADNVTINPAVPKGVGVRIVELTSARFPDGSAAMDPAHAAELDRVAAAMTALPNTTALVIGHADQRGSDVANYVLSAQRADAVVQYLASKGIAPTRLASRAVGEADLLSLNNDAAAFALNKRTEFVLFGLLEG
jgi:outer membrane protein OmpA-like peptidoglycan-associated protein